MPASDPWLWTTDDLVAEICNLFKQTACKDEDVTSAAVLASYLHKQQITGAMFLTNPESYTLGDETVFSQNGRQKAAASAVQFLRDHSPMYQQHIANIGAATPDLSILPSLHPTDTTANVTPDDQHSQTRANPAQVIQGHAITNLQSTAMLVGEQSPVNESQWDHLLRWSNLSGLDDVDLAVLNELEDNNHDEIEGFVEEDDDDDDNNDHDDHDIHEELEQIKAIEETGQGRNKLTKDQIVDVINQCIAEYTESWRPNKEVLKEDYVEYDPEQMWLEAEAAGARKQFIIKHEAEVAYFGQRLDRLCEETVEFSANTVERLRAQTGNLELTVYSLELAKWLLSIYQLEPESDDGTEPDISNASTQSDPLVVSQNLQSHRAETPVERSDLGSLSKSSRGDPMDLDDHIEFTSYPLPTELNPEHQLEDMIIADSVHMLSAPIVWPILTTGSLLFSNAPEDASILSVQSWRWTDLISTRDRKRVVSKTVHEMGEEKRELIRHRLKCVGAMGVIREIPACVEMLLKGSKMPGILQRDSIKIETITRLFFSWWFCDDCFQREMSSTQLEELRQCLHEQQCPDEEVCPDLEVFANYLHTIFSTTTFNEQALKYPDRPSQAEIIVISDDDEETAQASRKSPMAALKISPSSQRSTLANLD